MVLVPSLMGRKAVLYEEERGRLSLFGAFSSSKLPVPMIHRNVESEMHIKVSSRTRRVLSSAA